MMLVLACTSLSVQANSSDEPLASSGEIEATQQVEIDFLNDGRPKLMSADMTKNLIFFKALINGREEWVLLDNGADNTVIDLGLAGKLGVPIREAIGNIRSPSRHLDTYVAEGVHVRIPGQFAITGPMFSIDLSVISEFIDRPVGMVLGNDILASLAYTIDGENGSILFVASGGMKLNGDRIETLSFIDGVLRARVDGKDARFRIDLGSNHTVTVFDHAWERLLGGSRSKRSTNSVDVSGTISDEPLVEGVPIGIGGLQSDETVNLSQHPSRDIDGHIGFKYFSDKIVLFDQAAGSLTIAERSPQPEQ